MAIWALQTPIFLKAAPPQMPGPLTEPQGVMRAPPVEGDGDVLRSRAPAPDEEPIAWAEGRGAAFPQEHAGVDRGGAARDRA